jgi:hypothetical protein
MQLKGFFGASVKHIGGWKNGKYICGAMSVLQRGDVVN